MTIKQIKHIAIFALFFALAGCSEDIKSVEYYTEHAEERSAKLTECDSSAENKLKVNCMNASSAHSTATMNQFNGEGLKRKSTKD